MKRKVHTYEADELVVEYDAARCIHAAECVRGLPTVFDPKRRPWVAPALAPADAVAEVVRRCPTGALHYRHRTGEQEQHAEANEVQTAADGPLYLQGRLRMRLPDGETIEETRVALCRCGASENKPFCDNSHGDAGFRDTATNLPQQLAQGTVEQRQVVVTFAPDGPILMDGPLTVRGADASTAEGVRGALCRCGESQTKPFCDGSHSGSGFQAD